MDSKRLWGMIDGEPWLLSDDESRVCRADEPLFMGKQFLAFPRSKRKRMVMCNPPLSFSRLRLDQYLDTNDIARLRGCHRITIARHVDAGLLKVGRKVGREFFFLVKDVRSWIKLCPNLRRGVYLRPIIESHAKTVSPRKSDKKGGSRHADKKRTARGKR